MNMIEMTVTGVLTKPMQYEDKDLWLVDVMADAWGREMKTTVMKTTKEAADAVVVGSKFEG